ncbi:MAG: GIY-YIG nuclease family protein [Candidatus Acidiferrales bacterium]
MEKAFNTKSYCVYILASASGVLYVGMTNSLVRRVFQHKQKRIAGFTQKYNVTRLVHYEVFEDVHAAIRREKRIKAWRREKKIALIEAANPRWVDLSEGWYEGEFDAG